MQYKNVLGSIAVNMTIYEFRFLVPKFLYLKIL